jgi:hypothetical protein
MFRSLTVAALLLFRSLTVAALFLFPYRRGLVASTRIMRRRLRLRRPPRMPG